MPRKRIKTSPLHSDSIGAMLDAIAQEPQPFTGLTDAEKAQHRYDHIVGAVQQRYKNNVLRRRQSIWEHTASLVSCCIPNIEHELAWLSSAPDAPGHAALTWTWERSDAGRNIGLLITASTHTRRTGDAMLGITMACNYLQTGRATQRSGLMHPELLGVKREGVWGFRQIPRQELAMALGVHVLDAAKTVDFRVEASGPGGSDSCTFTIPRLTRQTGYMPEALAFGKGTYASIGKEVPDDDVYDLLVAEHCHLDMEYSLLEEANYHINSGFPIENGL